MSEQETFHVELFRESTGSVLRVPVPKEINEAMNEFDPEKEDNDEMVDFTLRCLVQWYKDEFMHDGWEAVKVHHGLVD